MARLAIYSRDFTTTALAANAADLATNPQQIKIDSGRSFQLKEIAYVCHDLNTAAYVAAPLTLIQISTGREDLFSQPVPLSALARGDAPRFIPGNARAYRERDEINIVLTARSGITTAVPAYRITVVLIGEEPD